MPSAPEDAPVVICCGLMLSWLWNEDIWAAFCRRCGRAIALCEPVPAAFAVEGMMS